MGREEGDKPMPRRGGRTTMGMGAIVLDLAGLAPKEVPAFQPALDKRS